MVIIIHIIRIQILTLKYTFNICILAKKNYSNGKNIHIIAHIMRIQFLNVKIYIQYMHFG